MSVSMGVLSKGRLYKEMSLQIDTIFHNIHLLHLNLYIFDVKTHPKIMWVKHECTFIIIQKLSGKMKVSILNMS
jgi:hypothetical protein